MVEVDGRRRVGMDTSRQVEVQKQRPRDSMNIFQIALTTIILAMSYYTILQHHFNTTDLYNQSYRTMLRIPYRSVPNTTTHSRHGQEERSFSSNDLPIYYLKERMTPP